MTPGPKKTRIISGIALAATLCVAASCRLEREAGLLDQQYAVGRLDYSRAELQYLEQEYRREQAHVDEMRRRVDLLKQREHVLATEASDLEERIVSAETRLRELQQRAKQIEEGSPATAAEGAKPPGAEKSARAKDLEAKLADLLEQAALVAHELERESGALQPTAPPAVPAPAPKDPGPGEGGGGGGG